MGHLQPLLPYAKALVARGHEVRVAGPADLREPLLSAGLEHAPFGHPGDQGLAPIWARLRTVPVDQQVVLFVREIFAGANAQAAFPGLLETLRVWQPHLIVRDSVEFAAIVAAEVAGVPHVRVAVHQRVMEEQIGSLAAAPVDTLRRAAGLAVDEGASLGAEPIFTSFPESFEGRTQSAGSRRIYRVGQGKGAPPSTSPGWQPDGDGLPVVYITFGTVATTMPEALSLYQTAIAAVAQLPVRALLTTGRGFDVHALGAIPANVRVEAWVPQAEVFPHTAVMVCHMAARGRCSVASRPACLRWLSRSAPISRTTRRASQRSAPVWRWRSPTRRRSAQRSSVCWVMRDFVAPPARSRSRWPPSPAWTTPSTRCSRSPRVEGPSPRVVPRLPDERTRYPAAAWGYLFSLRIDPFA